MSKIYKLTVNEKKIISCLDLNARMPYSLIGKRLKKSQQQVNFIVERLKKKVGIFRGMADQDKALLKNKGIL